MRAVNPYSSAAPNNSIAPKEMSACPKDSLNEDKYFNQKAFDEYADIVFGITAEGRSMISKMKGLLNPSIKCEIDYEEGPKDLCNELMHWKKG